MNRLKDLQAGGVSVWLDTLSRDLLEDGGFEQMMSDLAVTGATSNPTIFAKAICGSDRYDSQLLDLLERGVTDPRELFLDLALADVREAARLLRPLHEETDGHDGYVSFECTPDVAYSTTETVTQAVGLWERLAAPNVMIKVPATAAGVGAIEALTARGVNVNVTLLFGIGRYEEVIEAYLRGLETRFHSGLPVAGIHSVASFFVSRVDAKADALLAPGSALRGHVGIANAQTAYSVYRAAFRSARWRRLATLGATPQRPLWASTATKDPSYRDVMYLEQLALPDTILTVPEPTLRAFADHGTPDLDALLDIGSAPGELTAAGTAVDLDAISADLEREGVDAFCKSYRQLLDCIETRTLGLRADAGLAPLGLVRTGPH
jgi:transaldolase